MGAKLKDSIQKDTPSPAAYNIPSKITESPGKTMAQRLKGSMDAGSFAPGPGAYEQDKLKKKNL